MPTKIFSLSLLVLILSSCGVKHSIEPYTLKEKRTDSCQMEIEETISSLINAKNLTISKDVFSKTSSLHLTNQKNGILFPSPLLNDLRGRKTLLLYKSSNDIYIGLMNEEKSIIKSKKLTKCF